MRARTILAGLVLCVAGGCQVLAQLDDLQVSGTGGAASTSSGSTTSTSVTAVCTPACGDGGVCVPGPQMTTAMCQTCGFSPEGGKCATGCQQCVAGVCMPSCTGDCSSTMLDTTAGPVSLQCAAGECTGTLRCNGPFPCEVDCATGACGGLTLYCDPYGPCVLSCKGMACTGANLVCGANECTIKAPPPPPDAGGLPYSETCGDSCGCTVQNIAGM